MVVRFLDKQALANSSKPRPLLNEMNSGLSLDSARRYVAQGIMNQIKQSPELLSIIDTVVTDHFMGPIDFFDLNGNPLGPTNFKKAQRFWVDHDIQTKVFYGMGVDYFYEGNSFMWHLSIGNSEDGTKFKEAFSRTMNSSNAGTFGLDMSQIIGFEIEKPRKVNYLAASTVEIIHNQFDILGYKQDASGEVFIWSPQHVEHIKMMEINNEVRGFCSIKALSWEIAGMFMLKENIFAQLENGGSPDTIIALKNSVGAGKARFERFKTALESFSHIKKAHGNMAIDADINVFPMGTTLKDMEYQELAMFTISEFCLAAGMPINRLPFLMTGQGGQTNKGEMSTQSEDAYQKKINSRRSVWEQKTNKVFRKAGFMYKFRRDNLQDDIRETSASVQRSAYVQGVQANLMKVDKQLKVTSVLAMLSGKKMNINEDDVEPLSEDNKIQKMGLGNEVNNTKATGPQNKGPISSQRETSKEKTANNKGVSA